MTPSQVWNNLCTYIFEVFPDCAIRKQYKPVEDLESLADEEKPVVWVGLANANIGSVIVNAQLVEDMYNFQLTLVWKLRNSDDFDELDDKLNKVQEFLTIFRHKAVDVGNSRLYFGLPSCDSPFDEDLLTSPGLFVSTCTVPITVYRDLNQQVTIVDNASNDSTDQSSIQETPTEG